MIVSHEFVDGLKGMVIGAVDSTIITDNTPLDPDQWENGQPWHWKPTKICLVCGKPILIVGIRPRIAHNEHLYRNGLRSRTRAIRSLGRPIGPVALRLDSIPKQAYRRGDSRPKTRTSRTDLPGEDHHEPLASKGSSTSTSSRSSRNRRPRGAN